MEIFAPVRYTTDCQLVNKQFMCKLQHKEEKELQFFTVLLD